MEKQPNLIYIFADQLSRNRLGFGGDPKAKTPFLDAFAGQSVDLVNACSGHPLGGPYRASLFTGEYSTATGMVINALRLYPGHRFFAQILRENGRRAAFIGKWNLWSAKLGKSHTVKNSYIPAGEYRFGFDDYFAAYDYHHRYFPPDAYYHLDSEEKHFCRGFEPDHQTDLAIEKIKEYGACGQPFALFLSFGTPHKPWNKDNVPQEWYDRFADVEFTPPENYSKKNDPHADPWARLDKKERAALPEALRCYYAMVANLDENLRRLYAAVEEAGLAEDTVFVFTSDHGELFGAHGRQGKNIFYDEAVNVPFLIRFGSRLPAGQNATPLNTVDIMPTLLSLLGIKDKGHAQGRDLSAALRSGECAENPCLMMGTGPTAVWGNGREWRGLRTDRYTYATFISGREEFLFDHRGDPLQMKNLAGDKEQKHLLEELRRRMQTEMIRIGDDFEPNSYYKKNWADGRIIRPTLVKRVSTKK